MPYKNKEKAKEYGRQWRLKNKEKIKEKAKEYGRQYHCLLRRFNRSLFFR